MGSRDVPAPRCGEAPASQVDDDRSELVRRVAASSTFEKSTRLRAFLVHVCRCALENRPEAATEHQIAIHVYDRTSGYNPNEDNIVRSQARLLRMKLDHYFATDGLDEPVIISIPKGRYLPVFTDRPDRASPVNGNASAKPGRPPRVLAAWIAAAVAGLPPAWVAGLPPMEFSQPRCWIACFGGDGGNPASFAGRPKAERESGRTGRRHG